MAGAPYVGCDIGGFFGKETEPELLVRWMQLGVFMPLMRVHSSLRAQPHWPWLFEKETSDALRQAVELRYRLLPYHYSLAHGMFSGEHLWMRPLAMKFPDDPEARNRTQEWMDGRIIVAPILEKGDMEKVYIPEGMWYRFNSSESEHGPVHINRKRNLSAIPAFVKPGTILTLAPVVQSTAQLPNGPMDVQVYTGEDGSYDMVEDDGESIDYTLGRV